MISEIIAQPLIFTGLCPFRKTCNQLNYILKVLYTGMQWKALPIEKGPEGKAELHYTGIVKLFARWAEDGSLERAFIASVKQLADTQKLDLSLLHGDGSNTVAKKGGTQLATAATNTRRARK